MSNKDLHDFDEDALLDAMSGGGSANGKQLDEQIWVELEIKNFKRGEFKDGSQFFDGSATVIGEEFMRSAAPFVGASVEAKYRPVDGTNFKVWTDADGNEYDNPTATKHNNLVSIAAVKACRKFHSELNDAEEFKDKLTEVEGLTGERAFAMLKRKGNGRSVIYGFFAECPEDQDPVYDPEQLFVE